MKKIGIVTVLSMLAAGMWATGCGASGDFACDYTTGGIHLCETITNPGSDSSALSAACTAEGGTVPTACSTSGTIGTCSQTASGVTQTITYYAGAMITVSTAQAACTSGGGSWTAG
jgi:hypothetical protein